MPWIPQQPYTTSITVESTLLNTGVFLDYFTLTKKARIRNVFIGNHLNNIGTFDYKILLYSENLAKTIAHLGSGLIIARGAVFDTLGYNNLISEYIHNGQDQIRIFPIVANRTGTTYRFIFTVNYDLWEDE